MNGAVKKFVAFVSSGVPLFLLLSAGFNVYLTSRLLPLEGADSLQIAEIHAAQDQIKQINDVLKTHVTKDEFAQVVDRIDHISTRVDAIYSIIATRK